MASLEKRYDGRYRIVFCWQGERHYHSLGKLPEREALSCLDRLEESLRFVDRELLEVPPDADLGRFLVSGSKLNARPALIQKAIGSLSSVWNRWARPLGLVSGPAPTKGVIYAKARAKPPFQTREQIQRQLARGGLSALEAKELWGSLFLTLAQVQELLAHVQALGGRPWVHVGFCIAAYRGARRSEILRSRVDDLDFEAGTITIREKKRDRSREMTFRSVPMSRGLKEVLRCGSNPTTPAGPIRSAAGAGAH